MAYHSSQWFKAGFLGIAASLSMSVQAAGFFNNESSVAGLGLSFAGAASLGQDASANWSNPATMTLLKNPELTIGAVGVLGNGEFKFISATDQLGTSMTGAGTGSLHDDPSVPAVVPATHFVFPYSEDLIFGASLTIPFGLATEYEKDSVFRYLGTYSELLTINLNPNVAYRVNDYLSVGAGFNVQYARVDLQKQANGSAVCFGLAAVGAVDGGECETAFGALPGSSSDLANDFENQFVADDVSWGWNIGLLLTLSEKTRLGATYRSKFSHNLDGSARFSGAGLTTLNTVTTIVNGVGIPEGIPAGLASGLVKQGITGDLDLPEFAVFSVFHQLTDQIDLLADISYIRWNRFRKIEIGFESLLSANTPPNNALTSIQEYHDTWRTSAGAQYHLNDNWTFRAGYMYDQSPIRESHRTVRLPGTDRHWASFGVQYRLAENFKLSASYAHIFFNKDGEVSEGDNVGNIDGLPISAATLVGKYGLEADLIGAEISWLF